MSTDSPVSAFDFDVVVVGGCGHVGLPLAIAFADRGLRVGIYDINELAVKTILSGELPFREDGASRGAAAGAGGRAAGGHRRRERGQPRRASSWW